MVGVDDVILDLAMLLAFSFFKFKDLTGPHETSISYGHGQAVLRTSGLACEGGPGRECRKIQGMS